ncbi:MAG: tRNA epoxyqueuosine(34) reductase QueG [Planctomycetota bacterium]
MQPSSQALEIALEAGFDLAGTAPLRPPRAASRFLKWLAEGRHGSMGWIERQSAKIVDPRRNFPEGKSILVLGLAHSRPDVSLPGGGRVARYAAGRDYHNVVRRMLTKLASGLRRAGLAGTSRRIVDAGPLLERSHAAEAGLGFESKAANLLHPSFGPWFFLGELLLDADLEPTTGPAAGSCGTCTACIDACPTGAIFEPGRVDARDCISYQTIENRGVVPAGIRTQIGPWVFGCDICSEVCPWGHGAEDHSARFGVHSAVADIGLVEWLEAGEELAGWVAASPLQRPGREGLARNAAIALGNLPSDAGRRALLHALKLDPSPIVREAAAWSLSKAHGSDSVTKAALERASLAEQEAPIRAAIQTWRSNCG